MVLGTWQSVFSPISKNNKMCYWEKLNDLTYVVAKVVVSLCEILAELFIKIIPTFLSPLPPPPLQIIGHMAYASIILLPP